MSPSFHFSRICAIIQFHVFHGNLVTFYLKICHFFPQNLPSFKLTFMSHDLITFGHLPSNLATVITIIPSLNSLRFLQLLSGFHLHILSPLVFTPFSPHHLAYALNQQEFSPISSSSSGRAKKEWKRWRARETRWWTPSTTRPPTAGRLAWYRFDLWGSDLKNTTLDFWIDVFLVPP